MTTTTKPKNARDVFRRLIPPEVEALCYPESEFKDANDWEQWKMRLWNQMVRNFGRHPGLAPLEQYMLRSAAEHRCIECGDVGSVRVESGGLICVARVTHYFMCQDCDRYWKEKAK